MSRFNDEERNLLLQRISEGDGSETPEVQWEIVRLMQRYCRDIEMQQGASLRDQNEGLLRGFRALEENHRELQVKMEEMLAPPWFPATYFGPAITAERDAAVVHDGHVRRVVHFADGIDAGNLAMGDQVFLSENRNLLIAKSPKGLDESGETGEFKRSVGGDRIVLNSRDEEVVVQASPELMKDKLNVGDLIRWDRRLWIAFEKIGKSTGAEKFLDETPAETFEQIGGLDEQISILQRSILLHLESSDLVKKYHLRRDGPGTGQLAGGPVCLEKSPFHEYQTGRPSQHVVRKE